jgi:hypothetical protein
VNYRLVHSPVLFLLQRMEVFSYLPCWVDSRCKEHTVFFMDKIRLMCMPYSHTRSVRKFSVQPMELHIPYMRLNETFTCVSRATDPCNKNKEPSH